MKSLRILLSLAAVAFILSTGMALAEENPTDLSGFPIISPESIKIRLPEFIDANTESVLEQEAALNEIEKISWSNTTAIDLGSAEEDDQIGGIETETFSMLSATDRVVPADRRLHAYLLYEPKLSPESESLGLNCAEVREDYKQLKKTIKRLERLGKRSSRILKRIIRSSGSSLERYLKKYAKIHREINQHLNFIETYVTKQWEEEPFLVTYKYHFVDTGSVLNTKKYEAINRVQVKRFRFLKEDWQEFDAPSLTYVSTFIYDPKAVEGGFVKIKREVGSEAFCLDRLRFDFHGLTQFQRRENPGLSSEEKSDIYEAMVVYHGRKAPWFFGW